MSREYKVADRDDDADDGDEDYEDSSSGSGDSDAERGFATKVGLVALLGMVLIAAGGLMLWRRSPAKPQVRIPKVAESIKMPLIPGTNLTSSWNHELMESMCKGRVPEGLPKFDDDDEDDADEEAFADAYEGEEPEQAGRRLKSAVVAVDGIRRFKLSSGATMPYYGSADIQQEEASGAEFAVFIFHGAVRDAINYFCSGKVVAEKQAKYPLDKVLLIVLKWHYLVDMPIATDVWWNSSKPWGSWMAGGHSSEDSGATISSFSVIDEFLVYLADNREKYPKLKEILLMGHSAGGQTLHRYSFATHLKPPHLSTEEDVRLKRGFRSDLDVRFVVANPSSYLYLDKHRWAYVCGDEEHPTSCSTMTYMPFEFDQGRHGYDVDFEYGDKGWRVTEGLGVPGKDYPFICRTHGWNNWFYGLNWKHLKSGFIIPYLAEHPDIEMAVRMYPERDIVYLVGQNDTCWDDEFPFCDQQCWTRKIPTSKCYRNHMDMRCPAMLQGPNRKMRALHYIRHLYEFYAKRVHNLFVVPNIGHQGGAIVTSDYGLTAIEGTMDTLLHLAVDPLSVPLGEAGVPLPYEPPTPPPPPPEPVMATPPPVPTVFVPETVEAL
eukprot:SRR837773.10906.p1 GENE.SRR837773.10906~~SRR837773.10906.p1  ORF type:complete len:604 (-),score=130.86 SRR837773.10906:91-1902(-)